jgi:protein-L-isoaspartate(D-aspartate) O-methyltransferase
MDDLTSQCRHMVAQQILARGVRDQHVLAAMGKVRREAFVAPAARHLAYADGPLPIGHGQTISQPYIVAFMIEALALSGGERALEIGAESGYAAVVLGEIAGEVYAIERIGQLAEEAASHLSSEGYKTVHTRHTDGTKGWVEAAPFRCHPGFRRSARGAGGPGEAACRSADAWSSLSAAIREPRN